MSATMRNASDVAGRASAAQNVDVSAAVYGFGMAAAITFLFNTALAWVKDAWAPLNTFMAHLTGHHWITHGLADIAIFLVLGFVLTSARHGQGGNGIRLAMTLIAAAVIAGGGLGLWFLIV